MNRLAKALLPALLPALAAVALEGVHPAAAAESAAPPAALMTEAEIAQVATDAYRYFYPIVTMDITRRQMTNAASGGGMGRAPMNAFANMRAYPTPDMRTVVRPNFDTLYSIAWLDLTGEPVIVTAPATGGRYYLLEMLDMWTDAFAAPGKRTTGTQAAHFALTPRGWSGVLPEGVTRIYAPTRYVWVLGRTQTNGPADYPAVHEIQDGFKITPLSQWGKPPVPVETRASADEGPAIDMFTPPLSQVNAMPAAQFFKYGHALLRKHTPHVTDWSLVAQLSRIGFDRKRELDFASLPANVQNALQQAAAAGPQDLLERIAGTAPVNNGWEMNVSAVGVYGNDYLKRAVTAMIGLGANQPEDAVYPMTYVDSLGRPLDGAHKYALHFARDALPPVNAFWSLTVYDAQGFAVDNPINRYALGPKDALTYNADGSLDLYVQRENPGPDKQSNWLPAPDGSLSLTLRLYWPKLAALDRKWNPPAVRRLGDPAF